MSSTRTASAPEKFDPSYFLFTPGSHTAKWGSGEVDMYDRNYNGRDALVEVALGREESQTENDRSGEKVEGYVQDGFVVADDVVEEAGVSDEEETEYDEEEYEEEFEEKWDKWDEMDDFVIDQGKEWDECDFEGKKGATWLYDVEE